MRKCLGKHSRMSSPFSIVILNGTCSLREPILFCGDVPALKILNCKLHITTLMINVIGGPNTPEVLPNYWKRPRRTVVSDWRDWTRQSDRTGLFSFVSGVLLSTFILFFLLSSSVSLSYFNLLFPCASVGKILSHEFPIFFSVGVCVVTVCGSTYDILIIEQQHEALSNTPLAARPRKEINKYTL